MASSYTNQCQHYYTLQNPLPLGGLWVEYFQPSLGISGKLSLSFPCISSYTSVQVYGGICHSLIHTFDSSGTMLDGSFLASHNFNMLEDIPQCCSFVKDLIVDVSVGQVLKDLQYLH